MKQKNYDKKKKDLKDLKRVHKEVHFESTKHRKAFIDDVKRSFRSLKRSEKQIINKQIEEKVWGIDDEQYDNEG